MTFISYAQNLEDVMLWRALKHIKQGFYIDVGAQDPIFDSVSKAFYSHGWKGIHIEPVPEYAAALRADRPDEQVLEVALSNTAGTLLLNVIPGTGLSTAVTAQANKHQEQGRAYQQIERPALTMTTALEPYHHQDIHWLKIDVEGFEQQVLEGWDNNKLRPWIMVVEATLPGSTTPNYQHWEPLVIQADYTFAYFDGLNRFYIANEHAELHDAFNSPPNIFDEFLRYDHHRLIVENEQNKQALEETMRIIKGITAVLNND